MKIAITQCVIEFRNGPYDSIDHGFYDMFNGHILITNSIGVESSLSNITQYLGGDFSLVISATPVA
jgi:ethanolamine utilization microcompartment shell protein EutS